MHLTEEVEAALQAAIAEARKRRHVEVTPVHLLATLPKSTELRSVLPRVAQQKELAMRIDQHLASLPPASSGYRSTVDSHVSDALESALRHSSHLFGLMTATVDDVFQALREDPTVNAIIQDATLDLERIDHVLRRALETVAERVVTFEHIVRIVSEARWFRRALGILGAPAPEPLPSLIGIARELAPEVEQHYGRMRKVSTAVNIMADAFLIKHLQDKRSLPIDVDPADFVYALVHDEPWHVPSPPSGNELGVVAHEADFVNDRFLADLMMRLGMSPDPAEKNVRALHRLGSTKLVTLPRADAIEFERLAREAARRECYPVRFSFT